MIRTSGIVAVVAMVVSLVLHGLGLNFTTRDEPSQPSEQAASDITDTGGSFEDFAETAPQAEQPDVTTADPVVEDTNTSTALVASDNPTNTVTPDAAAPSEIVQETPAQTEGISDDDQNEEKSGKDNESTDELVAVQPDQTPVEIPRSEPDLDLTERDATLEENSQVVTATVPELVTADTPDNAPEAEILEPEIADVIVASRATEPSELTLETDEELSQSAVTRSLRPPAERPSTEALGATEYVRQQRQARVVESPLDIFKRTGVDQLALGGGGSGARSTGFAGSGGSGNANVTNYVGRVLVQLNRFSKPRGSENGTARIQFQINPDGSVAWVRILRSSGSARIDRDATTQVRRAAPFPRPPTGGSQRLVFMYRDR